MQHTKWHKKIPNEHTSDCGPIQLETHSHNQELNLLDNPLASTHGASDLRLSPKETAP